MVTDLKQTMHKQVALSSHVPVALVVHNSYCNLSHLRAKSISSSYLFKDKRVFTNISLNNNLTLLIPGF